MLGIPKTQVALALALAFVVVPAGTACGSDSRKEHPASKAPAESAKEPRAEDSGGALRLRTVGRFASPTYLSAPTRDRRRVLVVERRGTVRLVRGGKRVSQPFLDLRRTAAGAIPTDGERGLLSIAFPRDYPSSRRFYVYFTDRRGDIEIGELRRSRTNPDRADHGSYRKVISQEHRRFSNHNGGQIQFGPDGFLYAALGDGGGANDPFKSGQDLETLLGKMIRIDPRARGGRPYSVPEGNPFRGRSGARPEIWAYGLRNPYRFSFDRRTGDLVIGDVGQNEIEEVDFLRRGGGAGSNFGWSCFEGSQKFGDCEASNHRGPVLERKHSQGACSITGGYVVRDRGLGSLYGRYLYGDFCDSKLRAARLTADGSTGDRAIGLELDATASFGEDACGRVYALSLNGRVARIAGRRASSCTTSLADRR